MTKAELRKIKQAERDTFDATIRAEWSELMCLNLTQTFEYHNCGMLHVYLGFRSEAGTRAIIEQAWKDGKPVVVPTIENETKAMLHSDYQHGDDLIPGMYDIPEPATKRYVTDAELVESKALVIAPMLAFNERLYRLGYGKGYYDRLLRLGGIAKFGLAFSFQFSNELLPELHDVALDAIVTEQGIARRKSSL